MARKVYRVVPSATRWNVEHEGGLLSSHEEKAEAVDAGREIAKANQPSQLMVHKADGTFEAEYTYGDDPFPPRG